MFYGMGDESPLDTRDGENSQRTYKAMADFVNLLIPNTADKNQIQARSFSKKKDIPWKIDLVLLLVVITLVIFGLIMVFSASTDFSMVVLGEAPQHIFMRQLLWLGLGVSGFIVCTFLDYRLWRRLAVPAMAVTLILLLGVLVVNEMRFGATRTLYQGSIQPSELAKLITVIYLAVWLYAKRERLSDIRIGLIPLAVILGLIGGLIYVQPDLSAVVTVSFLGGLLFFLAGGDMKQISLLLVLALVVGIAVVQISPTGSGRVEDYLAGLKDPVLGSFHVRRAFDAFVRGGWIGVGIGNAESKLIGLPVPPTDSIFAVVGEEFGTIGAILLVSLYMFFLWRGLIIARNAPDQLGRLLAAGLSFWIASEAFVNMAVMVNLLPFAGNALPFISAGGSNLTVTLAAVGILMNISRLSRQQNDMSGKVFNEVVDLRGRNGGRGLSSSGRFASRRK